MAKAPDCEITCNEDGSLVVQWTVGPKPEAKPRVEESQKHTQPKWLRRSPAPKT